MHIPPTIRSQSFKDPVVTCSVNLLASTDHLSGGIEQSVDSVCVSVCPDNHCQTRQFAVKLNTAVEVINYLHGTDPKGY